MKVLVCGVGGITGDATLSTLAAHGFEACALVHGEHRRQAALDLGARSVAVADYGDPGAMAAAMGGMEAVFFVAPSYREEEQRWVAATLAAAEACGVRRFVYQSVLHPFTPSMPHHRRKAEAEVIVRSSTLEWAIVQPAMYAQTVLRIRQRSAEGRLDVPYDPHARFTVVDVQDVASSVARVLSDEALTFGSFEIAGGRTEAFNDLAATMNDVLGESRQLVEVSPRGIPLPTAWGPRQREEYALMCEEYARNGLLASAETTRMLLRREPTTFAEVVARDAR